MSEIFQLLVCYVATLLSQFSAIYLFKKLSNRKMTIAKFDIFITLFASIFQELLNIYGIPAISTILTIVYFYFLFQHLFGCTQKESQNYSVIIWTISVLIDITIMLLVNMGGFLDFYESNIIFSKSIGTIVMSILLITISVINPITKFLNKLYQKICKLNIPIKNIFLIIAFIWFIGAMSSNNMNNKFLITVSFIIAIVFLSIIIIFISMNYKIITLKITNEILEKNNEVNQKAIYQFRILKHNLESQLLGVKTVANKKARELLDNLIKEYNESFYIKHDINSIPLGINGLVFDKLYKYNEDNIEISITNKIKSKILDTVGPRSYNLFCEALGVTLDNALESAKESKDKLVYIEFRENKEVIQMKIMNTFTGGIDLDKLGTVNYTSKSKGHGLGLYSLFGRKNLTITTSIKNNLFVNMIEVKKLKRK